MRITVGIHNVEDYRKVSGNGADEVFCGYIPQEWYLRYGIRHPMNRREVRYCNVQIESLEEMKLLGRLQQETGVPAAVTMNAPYYLPDQYPFLTETIDRLMQLGFHRFIVSDLGLLIHLSRKGLRPQIHLSGEWGTVNEGQLALLEELGVRRIIIHRKESFLSMKQLADLAPHLEFEAILSE